MNIQDGFLPNDDLERIDNVCTQFEESCKSGAPPQIEEVLAGFAGRTRQQALLDLLLLDLEYRAPSDLEQAEADYRRRFKSDWPVVATAMKKHRSYQSKGQPQKKKPAEPTPTELTTQALEDEEVPTEEIFAPVSVPERLRYLDDYELIEEIARGGMGIVYRAKDRRLNRIVAIKMLLPGELASEDQIDRFLREARTAAKLRHPNIVTVYEVGLQDEVHYFAMDYIDGQDLEKFSREHSLPTARAVKYVVEAARAVHYAHSQRVLHRDLKPSNLLIDQDGEIHVTDFGLAKSIAMGETITRTGMIMGTPSYMPPEQAKGDKDKIGVRSDCYGLGAVLFFLLTGHPPFEGDNPFEVITAVLKDPPPAPRSLNSNVPRELEMICLKCLEKEPEDRYRSAAALANDLERWLGNEPIRAREVGLAGRTRLWLRRNWKGCLSAVTLLLLLFCSFMLGKKTWSPDSGKESESPVSTNPDSGASARADSPNPPEITPTVQEEPKDYRSIPLGTIKRTKRLSAPGTFIISLEISTDGRELWASRNRPAIHRFEVESGRHREFVSPRDVSTAGDLAFSPDGELTAFVAIPTGSPSSRTIQVRKISSGDQIHEYKAPSTNFRFKAVSFSPDGHFLVAAGGYPQRDSGKVYVWDVKTGNLLHQLDSRFIYFAEFSPDSKTLLFGGSELTLMDIESAHERSRFEPSGVSFVATFSPDGKSIATAFHDPDLSGGYQIQIFDLESWRIQKTFRGHSGIIEALCFLPDGRHIISGANDRSLRIWNVEKGEEVARVEARNYVTRLIALSPGGRFVATGGGQVRTNKYNTPLDPARDYDVYIWQLPESVWPDRVDTPAGIQ